MSRTTRRRTGHLFTTVMDNLIIGHIKSQGFINLAESFDVLATSEIFIQAGLVSSDIMSRYYTTLRHTTIMFKMESVSVAGTVYYNRKQTKRRL